MFESILVRRTNPVGSDQTVNPGRLAEAMLFYQHVRLVMNRGNLHQFIMGFGPDFALELVENGAIDGVYVAHDFAVLTENRGTLRERYRPTTIKVIETKGASEQDRYEHIRAVFNQALEAQPRKARRQANRFLNHLREHTLPSDIQDMAATEWQRGDFLQQAVRVMVSDLAPNYQLPDDFHFSVVEMGDGFYQVKSDIDWSSLRSAQSAKTGSPSTIGPADFLSILMDLTGDLHLGAALDSTLSQDPLGAELLKTKCADLRTAADLQQFQIDQFQELVVEGTTDIAGAINSQNRSFDEFMRVQKKAKSLREWLDGQAPDADLVRAYTEEAARRHGIDAVPAASQRWVLPVIGDSAAMGADPHAAFMISGALVAYGLAEKFVIKRYFEGWRPASFVDKHLQPFVKP